MSKCPKCQAVTVACSACGELTGAPFGSKLLLGADDRLCWYCYVEWYDNGRTDRDEVAKHSRKARAAEIQP